MSPFCEKLNSFLKPIMGYFAALSAFWIVHYPVIWIVFLLRGVRNPAQTDAFHWVVALSRNIADAPIYLAYRTPYWILDQLHVSHGEHVWLAILFFSVFIAVLLYEIPDTVRHRIGRIFDGL